MVLLYHFKTEPLCVLITMVKRGRGKAAQDSGDKGKNKKRHTQQNGSASQEHRDGTPKAKGERSCNTAVVAGAGESAAATSTALPKGKGKGAGDKATAPPQQEEDHKEGNDGAGGGAGSKRKKRKHEEEGYEGPVEEEDSGSDGSSQGVAALSFLGYERTFLHPA